MKGKILQLLVLALPVILMMSCRISVDGDGNGTTEPESPKIEIYETNFVVDSEAQVFDVQVNVNMPFDIEIPDVCASWLSCSESEIVESGVLRIFVDENADVEERTGVVEFSCGETSAVVTVRQGGTAPFLELVQNAYVVSDSESVVEVEIVANVDYETILPDADWIECADENLVQNKLRYLVARNNEYESRRCEILYVNTKYGLERRVSIEQAQKDAVVISEHDIFLSSSAQNFEVRLNANVEYDVSIMRCEWLHNCPTKAMHLETLVFSVDENSSYEARATQIVIKNEAKNISEQITVTQAQKDALIVPGTDYVVEAQGGDVEVRTQSNVMYDVIVSDGCAAWIERLPETKSLRDDVLVFRISENKKYSKREGIINLVSRETNLSGTITIRQKARRALILSDKKEYAVSDAGGKISLDVGTETDDYFWTVSDGADWVTLTKSETGNVKTSLIISVKPNGTYSSRRAEIQLRTNDGELTDKLLIMQAQHDALLLDETEYLVGNEGGEITVHLKTNISTMGISSSSWISRKVATKSLIESDVVFVVQPNTAYEGRTGYIDFVYGDKIQRITVIQGQTDALILSNDNADMPWEGGTFSVTVRSNVKYSCSIPADAADWLSVVPQTKALSADVVSFVVSENRTGDSRSSEVTFVSEDGKQETSLTVSQRQNPVLEISKENYIIGSEGGQIDVEIRSNAAFSVSSSSWIHRVSQARAIQSSVQTFSVDENTSYSPRTGFITFSHSGKECTVTVEQSQKDYLQLSSNYANVPTAGGVVSFSVSSNVAYTVALPSADAQWIDMKEQVNSATVRNYTLTIGQNDSPVGRSSEIVFKSKDGSLESTFVVTQAQKDVLSLSESEVSVNSEENVLNIDIVTNVEYKVSVSASSWLSVLSSDNGKLRVAVAGNTSFSSRTGRVTVSSLTGRLSSVLTVVQSGKTLTLSVSDKNFAAFSISSEVSFSLETNGSSWSVSSNASWCRPSTTYGSSQAASVTLRLSENTTEKERSATVTVAASAKANSATLKETLEILVVQAPRPSLSLTIHEIKSNYSPSDGKVAIWSNSVWSAVSDASWCQVSPTTSAGDGEISVRLSQNDGDDVRVATITVIAGPDGDMQVTDKITVTQYDRNNFTIGDWETSGEDKGGIAE